MKNKYTIGMIDELAARLLALPPVDEAKRRINKQEAVERLAKPLATLCERGYSLEDVLGHLRTEGVEISKETLTSYLQRGKPRKKKKTSQPAPANRVVQDASRVQPPPPPASRPAVAPPPTVVDPIGQKASHVAPAGGGQLGART
jgi:hypothetical protein